MCIINFRLEAKHSLSEVSRGCDKAMKEAQAVVMKGLNET
jgi:hypothetical protein